MTSYHHKQEHLQEVRSKEKNKIRYRKRKQLELEDEKYLQEQLKEELKRKEQDD